MLSKAANVLRIVLVALDKPRDGIQEDMRSLDCVSKRRGVKREFSIFRERPIEESVADVLREPHSAETMSKRSKRDLGNEIDDALRLSIDLKLRQKVLGCDERASTIKHDKRLTMARRSR